MSTTASDLRVKRNEKLRYDPVRSKFEKEYKDFDNIQLLKEHLFQLKTQGNYLEKSSKDIAVIKIVVVIYFIASIAMGVLFGFVL